MTDTQTISITGEDIKNLAKMLAKKATLDREIDDLKQRIRENMQAGTTYTIPGYELSITDPYKFDSALFEASYSAVDYPQLYQQKPRAAAAIKSFLTREQYEALQVPGTPAVSVKRVEDSK